MLFHYQLEELLQPQKYNLALLLTHHYKLVSIVSFMCYSDTQLKLYGNMEVLLLHCLAVFNNAN